MSENASTGGGISFAGLLTLLFIGLKLTGYITWSWWWVLSPLWISFLLVFSILILIVVLGSIDNNLRIKRRK